MGQTAIETFSSDTLFLTQGFQQEISLEISPIDTSPNALNGPSPVEVQVYPNPVGDQLQVNVANKTPGEITIRLFTPGGQLVKTKKYYAAQNTINLSGHGPGLYILHVMYNEKTRVYKIVKHQ
jgi:hypothetical protein